MAKKETKPLNMNIDRALLARIDKYRFKRMFPSRSGAIESLLEAGLKLNPGRPNRQPRAAGKTANENQRRKGGKEGRAKTRGRVA